MHSRLLRRFGTLLLATIFLASVWYSPKVAFGLSLTNTSITLSNTTAQHTGTTHTMSATLASGTAIQDVEMEYATSDGGSTKPAHLDLSGATLTSTSNLGSGWTLDTSNASTGILHITNSAPQSVNVGDTIGIVLGGITNSAIDDCQPGDNGLVDTCYVMITTYASIGANPIDTGSTTYTVEEDPQLSFEVDGVTSGETHNGITASVTSTSTTLPFGTISPNGVSYVTHKLIISTNAPGGYSVTAVLLDSIHGEYANAVINQFGGVNATWTTPQLWSTPNGTTPNDNTGWFGANTSDTRVTGWSGNTSAKFAPLGTSIRQVAYSAGPDSGSTVYVSYALGVNGLQPSDTYSGTIVYNIQANY